MATYKLIIHTTNNYPYYNREEESFKTLEEAMQRMDEVSDKLMAQCRQEKLQDYNLEVRKESKKNK